MGKIKVHCGSRTTTFEVPLGMQQGAYLLKLLGVPEGQLYACDAWGRTSWEAGPILKEDWIWIRENREFEVVKDG